MKKINKIFSLLLVLVLISGCSLFPSSNNNSTNNNINNNITENTTIVGDITIEDMEKLTITAYEKVQKACIGVSLKVTTMQGGVPYEGTLSTGSGVIYKRVKNLDENDNIIDYTYYVFTNRHVILDDEYTTGTSVYAYMGDEYPEYKMEILGYDSYVDMAVCRFNSAYYIDPVEIGNSDDIKRGSFVFAVGCPEGFDFYNSLTFGVISNPIISMSEDTDDDGVKDFNFIYIQHDVAINPGNSGGGLFNLKGELIGINTLKLTSDYVDNMGFSVPSNILKTLAEDYIEKNIPIIRPRLGVTAIEVKLLSDAVIAVNGLKALPDIYTDVKYGIYVTDITANGSISDSGVVKDDIILEIDGHKLYNMITLTSRLNSLAYYQIGDEVTIKYYDRSLNQIVEETIILK